MLWPWWHQVPGINVDINTVDTNPPGFRLPFMRDKDKGSGGVTLISARGIAPDEGGSSEGGITLLSKRKLDTGLDDDGKAGRLVHSISLTLTLDCFKILDLKTSCL